MHKKIPKSSDIFNIEGILLQSEPMWRHTTFAVGGPADFFAVPVTEEDIRTLLLAAKDEELPVFVLGGGSNLLVADAGIRGLVIDTRHLDEYRVLSPGDVELPVGKSPSWAEGRPSPAVHTAAGEGASTQLVLGGGLDVSDAAWRAGTGGLSGLDFLFGMPGSVGGALWMNARCYNGEIADLFLWADVMNLQGEISRVNMDRREWNYKRSPFQESDSIILRAAFNMETGSPELLRKSMREKRDDREAKGHFRAPCAGSAFKNNRVFGEPSGALIDRCGLKGLRSGGASVSMWHGNIFINDAGARAEDILSLLETVADKVEEETGFRMEKEIRPVGDWSDISGEREYRHG